MSSVSTCATPTAGPRTLNSVRDLEASWGLYLPRPAQPNHSSREWLLTDNHYDGRVLLYAVVSWDDDDPGDYLAAGWWLIYPPDVPFWNFEAATRGVYLDGPELDPARPPDLPLTGTATYVGGAGGLYTYTYGRAWGELAGTSEFTEFQGPLALTADFDRSRITGCLGCAGPIETAPGRHLFSGRALAGTRPGGTAGRLRHAALPPPLAQPAHSRIPRSPSRIPNAQSRAPPGRGAVSSRTYRMSTATPAVWSARPMFTSPKATARTDALRAYSMRLRRKRSSRITATRTDRRGPKYALTEGP